MRIYRRLAALLLGALAALALLPGRALAADGGDGRLTVSYQDGQTPLTGAAFSLYRTAAMDGEGNLTAQEPFASLPVTLEAEDDEALRALASTLEGYVLRDKIAPAAAGQTGEDGRLSFDGLAPGLYLVLGGRHTQGDQYYDAAPVMVALPQRDGPDGPWLYDVEINAKYETAPVPQTPEDSFVTRRVLKVWEDEGHEAARPAAIVARLLRDGEIYDTVTLSAENNWRYTWEGLDSRCVWTVVEDEPEGYTVEMTREGVNFLAVNTWEEDGPEPTPTPAPPSTPGVPSTPTLPQTGQLWWPVPLLAAAGLLLIVIGLARRRRDGDEG